MTIPENASFYAAHVTNFNNFWEIYADPQMRHPIAQSLVPNSGKIGLELSHPSSSIFFALWGEEETELWETARDYVFGLKAAAAKYLGQTVLAYEQGDPAMVYTSGITLAKPLTIKTGIVSSDALYYNFAGKPKPKDWPAKIPPDTGILRFQTCLAVRNSQTLSVSQAGNFEISRLEKAERDLVTFSGTVPLNVPIEIYHKRVLHKRPLIFGNSLVLDHVAAIAEFIGGEPARQVDGFRDEHHSSTTPIPLHQIFASAVNLELQLLGPEPAANVSLSGEL